MKVAAFMSASSGLSGCAPAAVNVASASAAGASPVDPANAYSQHDAFQDCAALYAGVDPARAAECRRRAANMSSLY